MFHLSKELKHFLKFFMKSNVFTEENILSTRKQKAVAF